MSLLDNPPHEVTAQPYARNTPDTYGTTWGTEGDPVQVRGAFQTQTVAEQDEQGRQVEELFLFICRRWPFGPHTRVTFEGAEYEQVGAPRRYRMSPRTAHDDVILRAVGTDG